MKKVSCCDADHPEGPGIYWLAEVSPTEAGSHVCYRILWTVKETPQGAWVTKYKNWADSIHPADDSYSFWRSYSTLETTKEGALTRLLHKKASHVKHAKRRYDDAVRQLEVAQRAVARYPEIPPFEFCPLRLFEPARDR